MTDQHGLAHICRICNELKPIGEFEKHGKSVSGFGNRCLACNRTRKLTYRPLSTRSKTHKRCTSCHMVKARSDFVARVDRRSGQDRESIHPFCTECYSDPDSAFQKHRREYIHNYWADGRWSVERTDIDRHARRLISQAGRRARKKGVRIASVNDLAPAVADALRAGRCQVTNLPISSSTGRRTPWSPSLDRIVPSLGYVPGNVRVVCWAFNAMVGDWGDDVAAQVAEAFLAKRAERMAAAGISLEPAKPRTFHPSPVVTFASSPPRFPEPFIPCV